MRKTSLALAAGLLALLPASSFAQDWPAKQTIRMLVPYPAGGGTDVVARIVAKYLQERLHQTIIVENRGGANGAIGLQALKQSPPDGYTIEMTSDTPLTVNPVDVQESALRPAARLHPGDDGHPPALDAGGASLAAGQERRRADQARQGKARHASLSPAPASAISAISKRNCSRCKPASSWCTCPTRAPGRPRSA